MPQRTPSTRHDQSAQRAGQRPPERTRRAGSGRLSRALGPADDQHPGQHAGQREEDQRRPGRRRPEGVLGGVPDARGQGREPGRGQEQRGGQLLHRRQQHQAGTGDQARAASAAGRRCARRRRRPAPSMRAASSRRAGHGGHRHLGGAQGLGAEVHDVGEHQQRQRLVQRGQRPGAWSVQNARASATTRPGRAKPPTTRALAAPADAAAVAGGQVGHGQHDGHRDHAPRRPADGGGVDRWARPARRRRWPAPRPGSSPPPAPARPRRRAPPTGATRARPTTPATSGHAGHRQRPSGHPQRRGLRRPADPGGAPRVTDRSADHHGHGQQPQQQALGERRGPVDSRVA